jgi:hypothetical protein
MRTLEQAQAEYDQLLNSQAYAFAMGHGCSIGDHPEYQRIRRRAAQLRAIIHEHQSANP